MKSSFPSFFQDAALVKQMLPKLDAVCDSLNSWLDLTTLQGVRERDMATLSRCCRIYASIDRIGAAESLVRKQVVRARVESCLSEAKVINSTNLAEIFNNLLMIIPEHLAELVKLSTDERKVVHHGIQYHDTNKEEYFS